MLGQVRTSTWILWRHSSAYNIQMLKDRIYGAREVEDIFCSVFLKRFLDKEVKIIFVCGTVDPNNILEGWEKKWRWVISQKTLRRAWDRNLEVLSNVVTSRQHKMTIQVAFSDSLTSYLQPLQQEQVWMKQ